MLNEYKKNDKLFDFVVVRLNNAYSHKSLTPSKLLPYLKFKNVCTIR